MTGFPAQERADRAREREQRAKEALSKIWGTPPEGWRKMTEAGFARSLFFLYPPIATGYAQFNGKEAERRRWQPTRGKDGDVPFDAKLFLMHDGTGFAIAHSGQKQVGFFRWGCDHQYRELSSAEARERGIYHGGRCYHVEVCSGCGYINAYDSSD